jgi:hypothetical protein
MVFRIRRGAPLERNNPDKHRIRAKRTSVLHNSYEMLFRELKLEPNIVFRIRKGAPLERNSSFRIRIDALPERNHIFRDQKRPTLQPTVNLCSQSRAKCSSASQNSSQTSTSLPNYQTARRFSTTQPGSPRLDFLGLEGLQKMFPKRFKTTTNRPETDSGRPKAFLNPRPPSWKRNTLLQFLHFTRSTRAALAQYVKLGAKTRATY